MTRSERVHIYAQGTDDTHPLVKFAVSSPLPAFDFRINQFRGQMHLYRAKQNPKQSSANVKADGKVSVFMMILGSPIGINGQIHRDICLLRLLLSAEQTKKLFCQLKNCILSLKSILKYFVFINKKYPRGRGIACKTSFPLPIKVGHTMWLLSVVFFNLF